jgi:hypothetical protein
MAIAASPKTIIVVSLQTCLYTSLHENLFDKKKSGRERIAKAMPRIAVIIHLG